MSDTGITIAGWQRSSFIDFPGKIAAVLFFAGCNLRCPYCHNPGIVLSEFPPVDVALIKDYLEKHRDFIEGIVLSGGEPAIHAGLPGLAHELRALSFRIKLDTNGLLPDVISKCRPDYLALDIKTIPSRYDELGCGYADAEARLLRSIEIVKAMGKSAEVRITVAPRFIDAEVITALSGTLKGVDKVFLQQYKNNTELLDTEFAKIEPYSIEKVQEFRKLLEPAVGECVIR